MLNKNLRWNFLVYGTPLAVALVFVPYLFHGLGTERFGFLSLAWAVVGYSGMLDLGMGRAITRSLAQANETDSEKPLLALGSAMVLVLLIGSVGAILIWSAARYFVAASSLTDALRHEAILAIDVFALLVPLSVTSSVIRGALEARQCFPQIAAIRLPMSIVMYATSALVATMTSNLSTVALVTLAVRSTETGLMFFTCQRIYNLRKRHLALRWDRVQGLLSFGGWLTVSNIIGPIMTYADRFLISAVISLSAVAYYTAAYDVVTKMGLFTGAIAGVLFPEIAKAVSEKGERTNALIEGALSLVAGAVFPLCLTAIVIAYPFLRFWLGQAVMTNGGPAFQILAAGVFFNGIALVPLMLIHALGRSDASAKLHLVEVPIYLSVLYWALREYGITGAAIAWTLRVSVDSVAMFWMARRIYRPATRGLRMGGVLLGYGLLLVALVCILDRPQLQLSAATALIVLHLVVVRRLRKTKVSLSFEDRISTTPAKS